MKKLVVDLGKCNGCFNCQLACKDEHCGNDWRPITASDGSIAARVQTDEFGDFRYEGCEEAEYRVRIECPGYDAIDLAADCREADVVFDDIFVRS